MPDTQKYRNTMNLGREDDNKHGWVLGQIMHIARTLEANKYDYCGYSAMDIPTGALVRIIGIKQTDLNASYAKDGQGDGSGEPGYLRAEGMRNAGLWHSLEAKQIEDHPEHHYVQFQYRKVVDPTQYGVEV